MKKSTLALSVAAAFGGLVLASNVAAMAVAPTGATAGGALVRNADGIGHQLVVPYFSAQGDNATLLEITNHDKVNGKLVKIRFRGATNSDDLYDFTLLLSPSDVWTGAVSRNATTGMAQLASSDKSCVLPATAGNGQFSTLRTDQTLTGDAAAAQTREGYVEIITMADLPPAQPAYSADKAAAAATNGALFTAVKHVNGTAPCTAAVLENNLGTDAPDNASVYAVNNPAAAGALTRGMAVPSGKLSADWVIINQQNTAAWSGAATALQVQNAGANANGHIVFWPQKSGDATIAMTAATADPLLVTGTIIKAQNFDLPDMSTPYVDVEALAVTRANSVTTALAVTTLAHQIVTTSDIAAVTDVVFSQPTRRYNTAVNYKATDSTPNNPAITGSSASPFFRGGQTFYTAANSGLGSKFTRTVCMKGVNAPDVDALFDREETSPTVPATNFVVSPQLPGSTSVTQLCGETSVVSINQGGDANPSSAVSGVIARSDVTFAATYAAGWATWDLTTANAAGLPVIANTFIRARNGTVNYGFGWPAKVAR